MNANTTTLQLYDIYPLWHVPFWQTPLFYTAMAVVGTAIVFTALFLLIRKLRRKKIAEKKPWQIALEELRVLEQKKYETKDEGKHCYFAMTDILKRYLQARFDLPVAGMTDEELVSFLKDHDQHAARGAMMYDIVQGCMYIKFANEQAMQEQLAKHIALSISLVTQTIPAENKKTT